MRKLRSGTELGITELGRVNWEVNWEWDNWEVG